MISAIAAIIHCSARSLISAALRFLLKYYDKQCQNRLSRARTPQATTASQDDRGTQCPKRHILYSHRRKDDISEFSGYIYGNNISFIDSRVRVRWGHFSLVAATLNLLRAAIASEHDRYCLLSGVDYPVKSAAEISETLGSSRFEYIHYDQRPEFHRRYEKFYYFFKHENWLLRKLSKLSIATQDALPKRRFPGGFTPYFGSQWWCITHDCTRHVLDFTDSKPSIVKFFKTTLCSDEMYFQTIIMNSHFADNVVCDNLRYIDWTNCTHSPNTLGQADLQKIVSSRALFARKFDLDADPEIFDDLDRLTNN